MQPDEQGKGNWLDRMIGYFAPETAVRRAAARELLGQFRAADVTTLRADWLFSDGAGQTPSGYELSALRERSRDAVRNDAVAAGVMETYGTNVIGTGLRPQSRMRADVLGMAPEAVKVLQRQAEAAWAVFSKMASADNRLTMDELQFLALCKVIEDGEAIAIPTWADEPWRPFGRCVELLESERLVQPRDGAGKKDIQNGIRFGRRGQPLAYFIKQPGATMASNEVPAFDRQGRPMVLHIFPTKRPGQQRGIPVLAPVLVKLRDLSKFQEATLVTARVAACLAVFITQQNQFSNFGTETTDSSGTAFSEISPGMVARLKSGEGINVVQPNQPGDNYVGYVESLLRLVGVALGLPYELILKDFSKTNYSSARAALLEGRRVFIRWRKWMADKFCQPIWELVLEEAFLRGTFAAPDFYRFKHEYCRALWVGGSWGWVDPVKEVQASRLAIDYGLSTLAEESAAQGRDWEETLDQIEREQVYKPKVRIDRAAKADPNEGKQDNERSEEK